MPVSAPGAHGRLTIDDQRFATSTERMPRAWLDRVLESGHGELPREPISRDEQVVEMLLMGLRLEDGIDLKIGAAERPPASENLERPGDHEVRRRGLDRHIRSEASGDGRGTCPA